MASKLFRAVVGVGISLGTSSVACLGNLASDDPPPGAIVPPLGTAPPPTTTSTPPPTSTGAYTIEPPDADAGVDAARDVGLDAFCDASWPTTKGTPIPTCGPIAACDDAGSRPYCFALSAPSTCKRGDGRLEPVWCVSGAWQCASGFVPSSQCKCWEGDPCN